MTSCTGSVRGGFWGFEKSQLVEILPPKKMVTFGAHRGFAAGAARGGGGDADGKVSIERLCISHPYVEKPFNSKVIKSFVPELRSRKCFLCFGIPILSIYELWTFYVHFTNVCIYFERLVQAMEGVSENTRPPENKMWHARPKKKKRKKKEEKQLSTQGPQKKERKKKRNSSTPREENKRHEEKKKKKKASGKWKKKRLESAKSRKRHKKKKKKVFAHCIGVIFSLSVID